VAAEERACREMGYEVLFRFITKAATFDWICLRIAVTHRSAIYAVSAFNIADS
jgi:hypothetical protein